MILTDSHAHLPGVAERLGRLHLEALLQSYGEAWEAGEGPFLLDIGVEAGDFRDRFRLLGRPPYLRYSLGLWPGLSALSNPEASLAALRSDLDEAEGLGIPVAAIGECGLDYHHMEGSREAQLALFMAQLSLARERGLPLIVHSREAFEDTRAIIERAGAMKAVIIHCFGYGAAEAKAFLDLGCYVSFAGNLSYKKASALREACAIVASPYLLLETDAPYMNPEPLRGKASSPLDIIRTYECAAAVRGVTVQDLAETVTSNAGRLFT